MATLVSPMVPALQFNCCSSIAAMYFCPQHQVVLFCSAVSRALQLAKNITGTFSAVQPLLSCTMLCLFPYTTAHWIIIILPLLAYQPFCTLTNATHHCFQCLPSVMIVMCLVTQNVLFTFDCVNSVCILHQTFYAVEVYYVMVLASSE